MTVHGSQGATLGFALVAIRNAFSPGQLYVALSEVRTREHLRILHGHVASACTRMPWPEEVLA